MLQSAGVIGNNPQPMAVLSSFASRFEAALAKIHENNSQLAAFMNRMHGEPTPPAKDGASNVRPVPSGFVSFVEAILKDCTAALDKQNELVQQINNLL